ncbi:outer membrane beta-barrel protein [Spirosoma rhododendri]|uniref:PorT family protein n=1 Tax=Spirosoma rhododendri TaxID=2728024 RepID=A0A7L5DT28_9BACT|nr:outer membrane beta-barrel protein [Spirosoma rhododendri]QJD80772.1 PorT family protein [Spirosoma rhododendri]
MRLFNWLSCAVLSGQLLIASAAVGQRNLALSATVAPTYTTTNYARQTLYPDSDGQVVEPVHLAGQRSAPGFVAGVSLRYTYAPGWTVSAGLLYQQSGMRQQRLPAAGEGSTRVTYRSVRLPVAINFKSSPKPLSPYFTLALLTDFPLTTRLTATRTGEPTQQLRVRNSINPLFSAQLGAGGFCQLSNRYALIVQPTLAYTIGRFGGSTTTSPSLELGLQVQAVVGF